MSFLESVILAGGIGLLFLLFLNLIEYWFKKVKVNFNNYPPVIDKDEYWRITFKPISSVKYPRIIYKYNGNQDYPEYIPLLCNEDTFEYWRKYFNTCNKVWEFERKELKKYTEAVKEYLKKKQNEKTN